MGGGGGGQGVVSARYKRFCNNIIERRHQQRVWCSGAEISNNAQLVMNMIVGWGGAKHMFFSQVGSKQTAVFISLL